MVSLVAELDGGAEGGVDVDVVVGVWARVAPDLYWFAE